MPISKRRRSSNITYEDYLSPSDDESEVKPAALSESSEEEEFDAEMSSDDDEVELDDELSGNDDDDDDFEEELPKMESKKVSKTKVKEKEKSRKSSHGKKNQISSSDDDESSNGDGDFEEPAKKKKKQPVTAKKAPKKKVKSKTNPKPDEVKSSKPKVEKSKKIKELDTADRLNSAMQSFLWWEAPPLTDGYLWNQLEHAGVAFPDEYEPHGVKLLYDNKPVNLMPYEEEAATFFAAVDPDGMHLGNKTTAPIFIRNFFADFREVLSKNNKKIIKDFKKCNFGPIRDHLNEQKIVKKAITDNERLENKLSRQDSMFRYGYAIVDGHIEKVGNYNMEPPGTFRGRGEHPKMGKLKQRVMPEQVNLNLSDSVAVPRCIVPGHAWGEIRHDPKVQLLAEWKENINNQNKYMQLAAQSSFKGKSDRAKYCKAARLSGKINKIRTSYKKKIKSKDMAERQMGTAMWVIDRLALRVGGEKDTDEEADTVGCCSLRVEHLHFDPNNEGEGNMEIELEFLGKDSMLFKQTIDFGSDLYTSNYGMGKEVYKNFQLFCRKKNPSDEVLDLLTPPILNNHLKQIMDGLTAKVFRTYNASKTLQDELIKTEEKSIWEKLSLAEKVLEYNAANREVAILCNHQKSISKAQETTLENISEKLSALKSQRQVLQSILEKVKLAAGSGIPLRKSTEEMEKEVKDRLEKVKKMKDKAKTNDEKIAAAQADEAAKTFRREVASKKFEQNHLWINVPTEDQVLKRIKTWTEKITKMELDLKHRDDNKEVSLGTSKINYMDPRISVAFCKRNDIPIEKIFSKTLRDKFNWAMAVPPDWEFNESKGDEDTL